MKILITLGTRPEIIKFAPIIEYLKKNKVADTIIVHTGQHYDYLMWKIFFEEFNLPDPDYILGIRAIRPLERLSYIIKGLEEIMIKEHPDISLVLGDTDSALAGALVARRMLIPLAHIEAGLRSFNRRSPEELTRRIISQCALIHFAPTNLAKLFLIREGIDEDKIFVVGNTIIDVLIRILPKITGHSKLNHNNNMILVTVHRPENVDNEKNLATIVDILLMLAERYHIVFPVHPRTKDRLEKTHLIDKLLQSPNISITDPKGYIDFLKLLYESALVITDSGGVQEEASSIGKKVLLLRPTTPRWEATLMERVYLVNLNKQLISSLVDNLVEEQKNKERKTIEFDPLYGDGRASERIIKILLELYNDGKLTYNSPDLSGKNKDEIIKFLNIHGGYLNDST